MTLPAARLTDMHVCPMQTPAVPPIPHVGGPIISPGAPTVLVANLPAATMGCMCTCVGPPDSIIKGSATVLFASQPAARMGDTTSHGGTIVAGMPTVLIGG
ncbi:PAAR domain-containing protein [Vibrio sp. S4M6]|uniref:PAAR domain-containing protein n=1 Tax=Vibrio sinus TaxID=2946865 RepID=UPI00202A0932|nr:PAAR domain-containing protein [Vibrio sinus]MCL9783147.1 PAAR domain-containing protein [Vibrio sinus]